MCQAESCQDRRYNRLRFVHLDKLEGYLSWMDNPRVQSPELYTTH
jgi:hypothetical protein